MSDNLRGLHTYTVHLSLLAASDAEARRIAERLADLIAAYHQHAEDGSEFHDGQVSDSPLDSVHLTDADDWAESVGVEDVCTSCGGAGTERSRFGGGRRECPSCIEDQPGHHQYAIEDVEI